MSATLLWWWCALVLGTHATAAQIDRHDSNLTTTAQNETANENGISVITRNRRIVIEEVDRNGNSVLKELELPDYDGSKEVQEDKRRREQQEKAHKSDNLVDLEKQDLYGCHGGRGNQRRKCLQRQKKLLRKRYKNWKEVIERIIKDLDGKIKTLSQKESKGNLNFMSGFSPRNVMRKKE